MLSHRTTARGVLLLLLIGAFTGTANAGVPQVTAFPVVGNVTYTNDWHDPRPGGWHEGNDVMSVRHQPAVAFEAGWVEKWSHPKGAVPSCMLVLHGKSGMVYWYIHLNNDRGPHNDNDAGCSKAYAPGLSYHDHVSRGQLVGFVGDSGDANGIQPHLHFEVHRPNGTPINPLRRLTKLSPSGATTTRFVLTVIVELVLLRTLAPFSVSVTSPRPGRRRGKRRCLASFRYWNGLIGVPFALCTSK